MWNIEKDPWLNPSGAMISILDRPLDIDLFKARIRTAVAEIPRLRERVVPGFGRLSPPTWATDPEFDFDYHVRHIALPTPGTERQLLDLTTRLYEDPFDRTRPLWMFICIDGLEGGRGAVFSKMHHTVTDGIGAIRLSERYIEAERDAPAPESVDLDQVIADAVAEQRADDDNVDGGSPVDGLRRSLGHVARRQAGFARRAVGEVATWSGDPLLAREFAEEMIGTTKSTIGQLGSSDSEAPSGSELWSNRSRRRRLETISLPLDAVKTAGKALGGSINDVFVVGAAMGALDYHKKRGVKPEGLNASFVVSTRADSAIGGNSFTPTRLPIPGSYKSVKKFFVEVRDRMTDRREAVSGGGALSGLAGVANLLPTSVVTQMARAQASSIDFATSNLRGAWFPTYMSGAAVERNIVMGPVAGTPMNITTMSYNGQLDIGFFMDPSAIDDPDDLRECMLAAYVQLLAAGGVELDG
jgi:WS/DGAT/MGAT family acyltransferase